jgi:hypothetical protein
MLKNLNGTNAITLAVASAIFVMSGLARADGGDYLLPASYIPDEVKGSNGGEAVTCKSLRDAAWFLGEMHRTDGLVAVGAPSLDCDREIFAAANDDEYLVPVAFVPGYARPETAKASSCREQRDAAWFQAEMQRTDGQVSPKPAVDCGHDILAEAN